MKLTDAVYEVCPHCDKRGALIRDETYGCDNCGKLIYEAGDTDAAYLGATVFTHSDDARSGDLQFCSWKCAIAKLKTVETDYFVSLPYLHFNSNQEGQRARDFFALFEDGK